MEDEVEQNGQIFDFIRSLTLCSLQLKLEKWHDMNVREFRVSISYFSLIVLLIIVEF